MNKKQYLKVFGLVLVSFLLFNILPSSSSPVSPNVALDDLPSGYSFMVKTDGIGNYWAVNASGYKTSDSTSFVTVLTSFGLNTNTSINKNVYISEGTYALSSDVLINGSHLHFDGAGWGTHINFAANAGFSIAHSGYDSQIEDIQFKDMYFDGQGIADYGIRSTGMGTNARLRGLNIENIGFYSFTKAGTYALDLENLEGSWIQRNVFAWTQFYNMRLTSQEYEVGNIWIRENQFISYLNAGGASGGGLLINNTNTVAHETIGPDFHILSNLFTGRPSLSSKAGITIIASSGSINTIEIGDNHNEFGHFLNATGSASGPYYTKYMNIHDNTQVTSYDNTYFAHFGVYTQANEISGTKVYGSGSSYRFVIDEQTSTTFPNQVHDNILDKTVAIAMNGRTTVWQRNRGAELPTKTSGQFAAATVGYNGTGGAAANTIYKIVNTGIFMTLNGTTLAGTLRVYDKDGTIIADVDRTTVIGYYLPLGFKINFITDVPSGIIIAYAWT